MREIKFAWVCRNLHFNEIERVELTDNMLIEGSYPSWITSSNCEIIAKILPTGLKDKNGKEIWEDDFLKTNYRFDKARRKEIHRVARIDSCWFMLNPRGNGVRLSGGTCEETEIIGNKYEHPEPLTHGKG